LNVPFFFPNANEVSLGIFRGIEVLDGNIHRVRRESRPPQKPDRQCDAERLVAQLVTGNEQYGTW
jgi:hypothetical protein